MFHASFMTTPTCFVHILYRFDVFSGTNLLTRCRSASSCFLLFLVSKILERKYSRNWTKSTPGILFFPEASRAPKRGQRGANGAPPHMVARPRRGRAPLWCGSPLAPLRLSFGVLEHSGENKALGFCFVEFREYCPNNLSGTKNSRKQELALRHLVNRLVPENA